MFIEFNGLPGSGKTTVAAELQSTMKRLNCAAVVDYSAVRKRYLGVHKLYTLFGAIRYGDFRLLGLLLGLLVRLRTFELARLTALKNLYLEQCLYRRLSRQCRGQRYLIVDQGLMQGLVSLLHTTAYPDQAYLAKLVSYLLQSNALYLVHCCLEEQENLDRLRARGSKRARFDLIGDREELLRNIQTQGRLFKELRQALPEVGFHNYITIDTADPVEENVTLILKGLAGGNRHGYNQPGEGG